MSDKTSDKKASDNKTSDTSTNTSTNTSIIQLLPCPFCPSGIAEKERIFMIGWVIKCRSCGASSPVKDRLEDAIASWNTRKPMERIVERLEELREVNYQSWKETEWVPDKTAYINASNAYKKAIEIVKEEMEV